MERAPTQPPQGLHSCSKFYTMGTLWLPRRGFLDPGAPRAAHNHAKVVLRLSNINRLFSICNACGAMLGGMFLSGTFNNSNQKAHSLSILFAGKLQRPRQASEATQTQKHIEVRRCRVSVLNTYWSKLDPACSGAAMFVGISASPGGASP